MNAIQAKNLMAAARIFARKSSQIHANRPLEQNAAGNYLAPKNPLPPGVSTVKLPELQPYQMPEFERWADNLHTGNPPPLHKKPPNQRDLHGDYNPFAL